MTINGALLPGGFQSKRKEGRYVEFHADGSLAHVGFYVNGQPRGWILDLDPHHQTGRVEKIERSRFTYPDEEETLGGEIPSVESERLYREWVKTWIGEVEVEASDFEASIPVMRCSFCQKRSEQVRKMIAGPTNCICNECIELCNQLLAEEGVYSPLG